MISIGDLNTWLESLAELYGGQSYNGTLVAVLFKQMRNLSRNDLELVRDSLLMEARRQPTAGEILRQALPHIIRSNETARQAQLDAFREKGIICKHCDNSGRVEAKRVGESGRTHMLACGYCDIRNVHGIRNMPIWGPDSDYPGFRRVSVYDISQHAKTKTTGVTLDQVMADLVKQFSMEQDNGSSSTETNGNENQSV